MPDDQDSTQDGTPPRPRRRRTAPVVAEAAVPPEATDGKAATRAATPTKRTATAGGLRVARAAPTRTRRTATIPAPTPTEPGSALPDVAGAGGIDGVPATYDDGAEWLRNGVKRHPWGVSAALVFGWTGVWLGLWGAAFGLVVGALVSLGTVDTSALGSEVTRLGGGQSITIVSILAGMFFGAIGGFVAVVRYIVAATPWEWIVAIASGAILATIITVCVATFERLGLRMRGYRRLSRDEVRRVAPLVREVAEAMDLDGLPRFAMDDSVIPNAWTHMRTIVITAGLLQTLDDAELRSVLAHELQHWRSGDAVGLHVVWAAAWPIAITLNLGMLIAGRNQYVPVQGPARFRGILVLIGWAIAWPAWVILRLVIAPAVAASQRRYEYDADAAAAQLGYAAALISALRKMGAFEGGRTGWEQAMMATHPPTELRIEALQPPRPDDAEYQEDELRAPRPEEVGRILRGLLPRRSARSGS
jgi:Zn-dependent protease with chaperone function